MNEGSVYPAFARLEREGAITSRLVASAAGPARKYYRVSESGYARLAAAEAAWRHLAAVIDPLLAAPLPAAPEEAVQ